MYSASGLRDSPKSVTLMLIFSSLELYLPSMRMLHYQLLVLQGFQVAVDYLRLAATVQKVHRHCDLLGDRYAHLPRYLHLGAAVQQLEQVAALAVVDQQVVVVLLFGDCY